MLAPPFAQNSDEAQQLRPRNVVTVKRRTAEQSIEERIDVT